MTPEPPTFREEMLGTLHETFERKRKAYLALACTNPLARRLLNRESTAEGEFQRLENLATAGHAHYATQFAQIQELYATAQRPFYPTTDAFKGGLREERKYKKAGESEALDCTAIVGGMTGSLGGLTTFLVMANIGVSIGGFLLSGGFAGLFGGAIALGVYATRKKELAKKVHPNLPHLEYKRGSEAIQDEIAKSVFLHERAWSGNLYVEGLLKVVTPCKGGATTRTISLSPEEQYYFAYLAIQAVSPRKALPDRSLLSYLHQPEEFRRLFSALGQEEKKAVLAELAQHAQALTQVCSLLDQEDSTLLKEFERERLAQRGLPP